MGRVSHVPPRTPTRYPELMSDELLVAVMGTGIVAADDPVLTADDLGLTRGDGVFDATRVVTADEAADAVGWSGHDVVLVKASRGLELERVSERILADDVHEQGAQQ